MATSIDGATARPAGPKLGMHHLAYLRAVAEGLQPRHAAVRYLGHDAQDGAVALRKSHNAIVDRVRALARRRGDPRWRLIGLSITPDEIGAQPPPVDEWAEDLGLGDFGHAELLALHAEAFPPNRKAIRNSRLRLQQLALLQALGQAGVEAALPHHRIDAWFAPHLSQALQSSGLLLLSDLQSKIRMGGRWWVTIPKIGVGKAERLTQQLEILIPGSVRTGRNATLAARGTTLAGAIARPRSAASASQGDAGAGRPALAAPADVGVEPTRAPTLGFVLAPAQLEARDLPADTDAVRAWIRARAGSEATAKSYRRELGRFLLFLDQRGLTLSDCKADDCLAYMALLQNVPQAWSAKRTAPLGDAAWSPFAGPLSQRSQQHAIVVVGACFSWLVAARYLAGNPWVLVNRRIGDDRQVDQLASRAIQPACWAVILHRLELLAQTDPAAERMVFLLQFLEATGLRAAELLGARLGDLQQRDGRVLLQVHGKGSKNRVIPVAGQAQRALARYLASRGLDIQSLQGISAAPILASVVQPERPLTYRSLYGSMKAWLNKAITASDMSWPDKVDAARASPHWLRHTCGTRALERGVPLDVVGQLLGHADPRTTAKYTRAQIRRVSDELEKAFG